MVLYIMATIERITCYNQEYSIQLQTNTLVAERSIKAGFFPHLEGYKHTFLPTMHCRKAVLRATQQQDAKEAANSGDG